MHLLLKMSVELPNSLSTKWGKKFIKKSITAELTRLENMPADTPEQESFLHWSVVIRENLLKGFPHNLTISESIHVTMEGQCDPVLAWFDKKYLIPVDQA